MVVMGADGTTRNGWVVAEVADDGPGVVWHHVVGMGALLDLARGRARALAVDVPIGLPGDQDKRRCDEQAKAVLREHGRGSSVFPAPPRSSLEHPTYAEARAVHTSMSAQTFALITRIADVDAALARVDDSWVVECHPEVVFSRLVAGPLHAKRSAVGAFQRLEALEAIYGPLPREVPVQASLDDALDALACALTARRWATGQAEVLGDGTDSTGAPMRIVV